MAMHRNIRAVYQVLGQPCFSHPKEPRKRRGGFTSLCCGFSGFSDRLLRSLVADTVLCRELLFIVPLETATLTLGIGLSFQGAVEGWDI
jgi:hypothetical protein